MNLEYFIAKKIHFGTEGEKRVSPPAVRIATIGVALGLMVMILSVAIVIGFKQEIRNKVIGFGSHVQITHLDSNNSYEMQPINVSQRLLNDVKHTNGVMHVQEFATKPGIIKLENDFQGVVLKGISKDYDWNFFKSNLVEGEVLKFDSDATSNDIMISKTLANKLRLKVGDSFLTYFVENNVRVRKFHVKGIYQTNFTEYDKAFILADLRHIQKLNGWDPEQAGGLEVLVNDYNQLAPIADELGQKLTNREDIYHNNLYVRSIKEINPQVFSWLDLLDMNVWIILILMISVAGFTMISGLLIIILERTNMIGIMKAMGANDLSIRKIFLYVSFFLVGKGMIWGNVIGLGICILQQQFHFLKLDPEVYYLTSVPIELNWGILLLLNLGAMIVSMLMLVGPSYLIAKIRPAQSIRFE
ncbi:ABC transporter permease [Parabacteroides sp. FAFU027]|uniref:ABC transporter permease n=1 Tax=Parabacteroides sp. FAFU027 TaxID=2922715 RepID=UPI001FAFB2CB|nr:FtsX-like permease family protein [Parabacteroides sp. FAFU027]